MTIVVSIEFVSRLGKGTHNLVDTSHTQRFFEIELPASKQMVQIRDDNIISLMSNKL